MSNKRDKRDRDEDTEQQQESKESAIAKVLLSNCEIFTRTQKFIEPEFFEPLTRAIIKFAKEYYREHGTKPSFKVINAKFPDNELDVKEFTEDLQSLEQDELNYFCDEVIEFCKDKHVKKAVRQYAEDVFNDKEITSLMNELSEALNISMDSDIGIDVFHESPATRLNNMMDNIDMISTGYPDIDKLVGGGVRRGDSTLFGANSGGGKSVMLTNIAYNLSCKNLNGVYITLELSSDLCAQRFDSIFTGIGMKDVFDNIEDVQEFYNDNTSNKSSHLFFKKMPSGTNTLEIKNFLDRVKSQKGISLDFVIVDYMKKMAPNNPSNYKNNINGWDGAISVELRDMYQEYQVYGFSAFQLNRSAVDADNINQSHIEGGISKLEESDTSMYCVRREEDKDNKQISIGPMKQRNSDYSDEIKLGWDPRTLRVSNDTPPNSNYKSIQTESNKVSGKLEDLMVKRNKK